MRHDVTSNWLLLVTSIWAGCSIWIGHDLVRHDHSNTELGASVRVSICDSGGIESDIPHLLAVEESVGTYPGGSVAKKAHHVR